MCVCIRVWIWDFCEFEALTGFQGILQLSCLRPIGGALTLSAGGMAAAEATREHSSPEPVCSSSLSLHTHIHLGTGDGAASSLPLSLDQVCALSSLEAGLRLWVCLVLSRGRPREVGIWGARRVLGKRTQSRLC